MALQGQKYIPSAADKEYVYECASRGVSIMKIVEGLDIDFNTWTKNIQIFSKFLKRGRKMFEKHLDRQIPEVVNSLVKKCTGYEVEEVSTRQKGKVVDGVLQNGNIEVTKTKKHIPPSDVAMIFFLSNREKERWKNSHQVDHTNDGKAFKEEKPAYTDEELAAMALALRATNEGKTGETSNTAGV